MPLETDSSQTLTSSQSTSAKSEGTTSQSIVRGTSITALWTLVSRFLGFIRDLLVARLFGASAIADCFYVAFRIPNLLRSLVAEGALSSAFVPVFTAELSRGKSSARETVAKTVTFLLVVTGILGLVGMLFAQEIVHLLAPGFGTETERTALCVSLTRIMLPYITCVSLVAMLNAALNSMRIFGAAAFAQVLMNLTLIVGALLAMLWNDTGAVYLLSASVLVGGLVQILAQLPALKKAGLTIIPSRTIWSPEVKTIIKLMLPAVFGATVYQLSQFVNTLLASILSTGSVAWLFYADRLTQLPVGIFSIALASVLLPALAQSHHNNNQQQFSQNLVNSLRYTCFFVIPLSGLMFILAHPMIALMFERGAFTKNDTDMTAIAVQALALGIWSMSSHSMISRAFIAQKDTLTPTLVGLFSVGVGVVVSLALIGEPHHAGSGGVYNAINGLRSLVQTKVGEVDLGHAGIALGSSASATCALVILGGILAIRRPEIDWRPALRSCWQSLIVTALICGAIISILSQTLLRPIFELALVLPALGVYLCAMYLIGNREVRESWQVVMKYIRRS